MFTCFRNMHELYEVRHKKNETDGGTISRIVFHGVKLQIH